MPRLDRKVTLVTGGAAGLGKAIAQRFASEGAIVIITDIQSELGQAAATEGGFSFLTQDVCDEADWVEIARQIERRFGRWDILVNNAGIIGSIDASSPEDTRLGDWKRIFAVNVEGVFLGCRAAITAMRRAGGGSIVNVSSIGALSATPYATAYGASKAAVRQLTKSVAQYCAEQRLNIRCNSVHPGAVRTALLEKYAQEKAQQSGISTEAFFGQLGALTPMGGDTHPEDVAAAVAFLASDEANRVTGTQLIVDGGCIDCDTYRPGLSTLFMKPSSSAPA